MIMQMLKRLQCIAAGTSQKTREWHAVAHRGFCAVHLGLVNACAQLRTRTTSLYHRLPVHLQSDVPPSIFFSTTAATTTFLFTTQHISSFIMRVAFEIEFGNGQPTEGVRKGSWLSFYRLVVLGLGMALSIPEVILGASEDETAMLVIACISLIIFTVG
jgi:hypothetical protein